MAEERNWPASGEEHLEISAATFHLLNETASDDEGPKDDRLKLFESIYHGYVPFCIVVGIIGNSLAYILIRYNRTLKQIPSNLYLLCLAGMSSLFLLSLSIFWCDEYLSDNHPDSPMIPFLHNRWSCKVLNFLAHFCDFATIWLIVLLVSERFIVLHKKKRALTAQRASRQIKILLLLGLLVNVWVLFIADLGERDDCEIDMKWESAYNFFINFETLFLMLTPSIIILVSNVFVAWKLQTFLKKIPTSPSVSFHTGSTSEMPGGHTTLTRMTTLNGTTRNSLSSTHHYRTVPDCPYVVQPRPRTKSKGQLKFADLQLTRSLLVVTWMFLLLNAPNYAYRTASQLFGIDRELPMMKLLSLITHFMLYNHHAFLFYFYIFYSPSMKRRLWPTAMQLLECYCLKPAPLAISTSNEGC